MAATSVLALLVGSVLAASPASAAAQAPTAPTHFATVTAPVGVAYTPGGLLVTGDCDFDVHNVAPDGTVTTYATLPTVSRLCQERYIAVSPGLGGFKMGYAYVTQQHKILQISTSGAVSNFASIAAMKVDSAGITFDTVGSFGFDIIVTSHDGKMWRINSARVVTPFASVGNQLEGPGVAPNGFTGYGGQVLAGSKFVDTVYAVDSFGVFSAAASWDSPEQAVFVPPSRCSFGGYGGAFFTAIEDTNEIIEFPESDFTDLGVTNAIVPSELSNNMALLTATGSGITTSTFVSTLPGGEPEASAFTHCSSLALSPTQGPVDTVVTVTGSGFGADESSVNLWFNGVLAGTGTTDPSGNLSGTLTVPTGQTAGFKTVVAQSPESGVTAAAQFKVQH